MNANHTLTPTLTEAVDVHVEYFTATSPEISRFPQALALIRLGDAPLPLVFIGEELFSTGGKVLIPEISRRLEALGLRRDGA